MIASEWKLIVAAGSTMLLPGSGLLAGRVVLQHQDGVQRLTRRLAEAI